MAAGVYFYSQKATNQDNQSTNDNTMQAKDQLVTEDGVNLAYDFYPATGIYATAPRGFLVLIHMMPATRVSWREFAQKLQGEGFASIAFDLRGHGESQGGPDGYLNFSDAEHQAGIADVEAAVQFMKKTAGATADKLYLVGASIGANLSLQYLAEHPQFKKAVLLSAGLNYRGLAAEPLARRLQPDQKILMISARDDDTNAEMNQRLQAVFPPSVNRELIVMDQGGHGTDMLSSAEGSRLMEKILTF